MQYANDGLLSTCPGVFCGSILGRSKRCVDDGRNVHRNALFYATDGNGKIRSGASCDCRCDQTGRVGERGLPRISGGNPDSNHDDDSVFLWRTAGMERPAGGTGGVSGRDLCIRRGDPFKPCHSYIYGVAGARKQDRAGTRGQRQGGTPFGVCGIVSGIVTDFYEYE